MDIPEVSVMTVVGCVPLMQVTGLTAEGAFLWVHSHQGTGRRPSHSGGWGGWPPGRVFSFLLPTHFMAAGCAAGTGKAGRWLSVCVSPIHSWVLRDGTDWHTAACQLLGCSWSEPFWPIQSLVGSLKELVLRLILILMS